MTIAVAESQPAELAGDLVEDGLAPAGRDLVHILSVRRPADQNPARVYLSTLAPTGKRSQEAALERIARDLTAGACDIDSMPWERLRRQHTRAILSWLKTRRLPHRRTGELRPMAPATINSYLAAVRGTLKEAWRLGLTDAEDYHRAADLRSVRGERLPSGRALTRGELSALFAVCAADRHQATGDRDAALIAVGYGCGPRRAELVELDLSHYEPESGAIRILGKGNKERRVFATNGASDALAAWLKCRGPEPGPLFCPVTKAGCVQLRRMTTQAVYAILRRRAQAAGINAFSPHDLRRTFISDELDAGADLVAVQRLAGHADPSTTGRYDRRGERATRKAAELLHVPYVPRTRLV